MRDQHYRVRLGRLDRLNGAAEYSFPTRKAAIKFGTMESARHPERIVMVKAPDGSVILRRGRKAQLRRKAAS